jgi:hypothetical protein
LENGLTSTSRRTTVETNEQVLRTPLVWEIPEDNLPRLVETFEKFTRRARKNHLTPPRFEIVHEADYEVVVREAAPGYEEDLEWEDGFGRVHRNFGGPSWMPNPGTAKKTRWVHYVYITIEGERPHVQGWDFVGVLDHTDQEADGFGTIIKAVPGMGEIPARYRTAPPHCDHCGYKRVRHETFIVRDGAGNHKQVGRSCLQEFFPGISPQDIVTQLSWLTEAAELSSGAEDEEFFGGGGKHLSRIQIEGLLCTTQSVIECDGWLSRTRAKDTMEMATADKVHKLYHPPRPDNTESYRQFARWKDGIIRRAEERKDDIEQMVNDALAWIRGQSPDESEDYIYNLFVITRGETVREDRFGLACSLMSAYRRHLDGEREKKEIAERPPSEFVGEAGKRALISGCECKFVGEPQQSDYGYNRTVSVFRFILFLRDGKDAIVWYANGDAGLDFRAGEVYDLVCTPKKHEEREDRKWGRQKRTVVNRCKIADEKDRKNKKLMVIR